MKQSFRELPSDFEITKPAEEWSNGLIVCEFKALGLTWDLKRSIDREIRGEREPLYTYLGVAYEDERRVQIEPEFAWLQGYGRTSKYHFPTLPGTVDPESAAMFLGMMKTMFERGEATGRRHQQDDFKKAIGIK
jgi:hypothetical protein